MEFIKADGIYKRYDKKGVDVLKGINLEIKRSETVAVVGASGVGKSTFLHILGALDRPTQGSVFYDGEPIFTLNDRELADFRNKRIGFVFQFHYLLSEFTAIENVMLPLLIGGVNRLRAVEEAEKLLTEIGLKDRLFHKPGELSGGEQQRVAIARALINMPHVLLADEPTGNLDTHTGEDVFKLMLKLNNEKDVTLIIVTHNEKLAGMMSRKILMVDGRIDDDSGV